MFHTTAELHYHSQISGLVWSHLVYQFKVYKYLRCKHSKAMYFIFLSHEIHVLYHNRYFFLVLSYITVGYVLSHLTSYILFSETRGLRLSFTGWLMMRSQWDELVEDVSAGSINKWTEHSLKTSKNKNTKEVRALEYNLTYLWLYWQWKMPQLNRKQNPSVINSIMWVQRYFNRRYVLLTLKSNSTADKQQYYCCHKCC